MSFIGLEASKEQIALLFSEIDLEKAGWISYEIYFLFLKYYFGSMSTGTVNPIPDPVPVPKPVDKDAEWWNSLSGLSALDRFIQILHYQLRNIFARYDFNKNMLFEEDEIEAILHQVFQLNESQVGYVLSKFFHFSTRQDKSLTFDQLIKILLEIYFGQFILLRKYKDFNAEQWKSRKISLEEFIDLVLFACFFLKYKPSKEDLTEIFITIDTDKDGFIYFAQYLEFIIKYLGIGLDMYKEENPKPI